MTLVFLRTSLFSFFNTTEYLYEVFGRIYAFDPVILVLAFLTVMVLDDVVSFEYGLDTLTVYFPGISLTDMFAFPCESVLTVYVLPFTVNLTLVFVNLAVSFQNIAEKTAVLP